ncbi:hypothetical protein KR222_000540 [Zaprionus bogoriensis]|nr:hypothetical protein KR222_000540 [Zaprionus bogoriensis]
MLGSIWNDPAVVVLILIVVLIADNLWSMYLLLREISTIYSVYEVPGVLRPYLSQDLFEMMRDYKLHKSWLVVVNTIFVVIIAGCLELYFGFYAFLWQMSTRAACFKWMQHELIISILFACLLNLYLLVKSLPGQVYDYFCIPSLIQREPESWPKRILGLLVDGIVSIVSMMFMVTVLFYVVTLLGQYAFLGLYALSILASTVFILLVPVCIDPFVGKRVPLENLSLQRDLENLTDQVGFPMRQVHIIKVRDPSSGSNAFFYGSCCLKRIVIFDTLLYNRGVRNPNDLPPEERGKGLQDHLVVAVVAHELGHWKRGHFYKTIIVFKLHIMLTLVLFALCFNHGPIYQAVGFEQGLEPIIVGFLIVFGYVLTPYFTLSNVLMLSMTRCFEYQADKFAFELGHARHLRQALLKLYADNLSFPISDECYSMWNHTHPTMLHRLNRLEQLELEDWR